MLLPFTRQVKSQQFRVTLLLNFRLLVAGEDFEVVSPVSMVFNSSDSFDNDTVCITINIVEDDIYEGEEQFLVSISSVSPLSAAVIGTPSTVLKNIQDNG